MKHTRPRVDAGSPMMRARGRRAWPALLLMGLAIAAAIALYVPALGTSFFADDYLFLDQVRQKTLIAALGTPDPLSNFYRPISRQLYFWTVAGSSNESARVFHIVGLAWFSLLLALLFGLARRIAGTYAATIATVFVALHYTADVPIRWACGSQELLSVSGALAALWLHLSGRRGLAAVAMAFAALSKEVVLLTPLIAVVADRRPNEPWIASARRVWPLAIGVAVWVAVWVFAPHTRQSAGTEIEFNPWSPVATYIHLIQVTFGAEARMNELWRLPTVGPPLIPLALAIAAIFLAGAGGRLRGLALNRAEGEKATDAVPARRHAIVTGIVWALCATLPVAAVAVLWSAYYFLFAMCGVAIALGAWLSLRSRWWAVAAIAVLAWGSHSARHVQEFATPRSPWTAMSHINKFYIDRATRYCERYLEDLMRMQPRVPKSSTLFFAGLKGNVAFQVANGPLMRWAYRDTSVRSYYLNNFSLEKARRGPHFFYIGSRDSLREMERDENLYARIAYTLLVNESPAGARDALVLDLERHPDAPRSRYWMAWCRMALGELEAARAELQRADYDPSPGPAIEIAEARAIAQRGDIAGALAIVEPAVRRHALDPAAHALLADLLLIADPEDPAGPVEAFAVRTLEPNDALSWRRWGSIQLYRKRYLEALASFDRYFKLAGLPGQGDVEAKNWVAEIKRALPGGDIAPEGLRE